MAVDERERMALWENLERTLGRDSAVTLMTMLPPTGWTDVLRKRDLDDFGSRMDARFTEADAAFAQRFAQRFAQVDARFAQVDARFAQVDAQFAQVDARFDALEQRMDARFALVDQKFETLREELTAVFRGELVAAVSLQTRTLLWGVLGAVAVMASLAFALVRFA